MNSWDRPTPFAAPNSRSTPKFRHSLTFTLLPINPRATLPHGRPRPGPYLEAPSPSTRRSAPSPTTHYPLPTTHCPLSFFCLRTLNSFASYHIPATPAVSCDYALFCATARRDPSYFQWLPHSFYHHGGVPLARPRPRRNWVLRAPNSFGYKSLRPLSRLFALFFEPPPFVFSRLQPLFAKHPGGGIPNEAVKKPSEFQSCKIKSLP